MSGGKRGGGHVSSQILFHHVNQDSRGVQGPHLWVGFAVTVSIIPVQKSQALITSLQFSNNFNNNFSFTHTKHVRRWVNISFIPSTSRVRHNRRPLWLCQVKGPSLLLLVCTAHYLLNFETLEISMLYSYYQMWSLEKDSWVEDSY